MSNNPFDEIIDRRHTGSYKWDVDEGELPMWVADMDFKTAPCVIEALTRRISHGVFGYSYPEKEWAEAYVNFYQRHYGWTIDSKDIFFSLGVVPTLSSSVRALVAPGEEVVIFPPVYNIFYNSIRNNGCVIKEVPLLEHDGDYRMDFPAIEEAFASPKAKLCIFCNPHNPVGRIWNEEELRALYDIAKKNGVIILSDEIHGLVTKPGHPYLPFLSLSGVEDCVYAAISPTKAFNLAGIHTSAIVIPNPEIRKKVERRLNTDECAEPNAFSCVASTAALNEGDEWLAKMNEYVFKNRAFAENFIKNEIPMLRVISGEGTYLLWVDCRKLKDSGKGFAAKARKETGLFVSDGAAYGTGGEGFIRINLACPLERVKDGLNRLKEAVAKD